MRQNMNEKPRPSPPEGITYLLGNADTLRAMPDTASKVPFAEDVLAYLNEVSRHLRADPAARAYPDVLTLAFWMRRASTAALKARFHREDGNLRFGRGIVFHIAPSNVAVNYAYSLATGLLMGNANIVRVSSKDFAQVRIINSALAAALKGYPQCAAYLCLIRYGRQYAINDYLSALADTRVIWGGDATIAELRQSPLAPRADEITFADRYSIAVIDSDYYLEQPNKQRIAEQFYNDTYLTDQNACTSPRLIVWMGKEKAAAQQQFWDMLYALTEKKYDLQPVQAVNKLTSACLAAAALPVVEISPHPDNLILRLRVPTLEANMMDYKDNSGYFFEYDCDDILDLRKLCNDKRCQTIVYLGSHAALEPLLRSGIKGVDRVVPMGSSMDFDLLWDGYDLYSRLTRVIHLPKVK